MSYHNPVMPAEAIEMLDIHPEGIYVDLTFGGGGHSSAILDRLSSGRLIAFDQDQDALLNSIHDQRFTLVNENFRNLSSVLQRMGITEVDGVLADLGISSHQIDEAERGFSTRYDSELDMRMDRRMELSARDIINTYPAESLTRIFREYADLNVASRLSRSIVKNREEAFIRTGADLKKIVLPFASKGKENSFLAQVYQALRIEVNDEAGALREVLSQIPKVLRSGGRMVIISYHSLEDRMVKNLIQFGNVDGETSTDLFGNRLNLCFKPLHRKAIIPSDTEIESNSRARSAKLRAAERI